MGDERRAATAAGGALGLGALAALVGACCAAPWAVGLLGVTAAIGLARMAWLQPYLLAVACALMVLAFWWTYRRSSAQDTAACRIPASRLWRRLVWLAAVLLALMVGAELAPFSAAGAPAAEAGYTALDDQDRPLRDDFNRAKGTVRLLFVVDPACPTCVRGLADLNDALLAGTRDPRLQTFVVHEPVIGGSAGNIPAAAALLQNPQVRHYWNTSGAFGRLLSEAVGLKRGSEAVYAWDVWLLYGPDAVWDRDAPPRPVLLMHQLEPIPGFSYLDSMAFARQTRALLAQLAPASSTR